MTHLIRVTNLRGFDQLVRERGGDPLPLLGKYRIPPMELRDDSSFILYRHLSALLEDTAHALNYPEFGLKLAEYQGMDILGPVSVIARSSATVGAAINSIARYLHLHSPALALSKLVEGNGSGQRVRFAFLIDDDDAGGYRPQAYELSLSNSMQAMKLLCGECFDPISVHFKHPRAGSEQAYREVFRCTPQFNDSWCGFCLNPDVFDIPLASADHQTWQLAEQYLASQQAPFAETLSEDVARLINTLLPTGKCSSETIASHLNMHKRTLQRRLSEEGVTYEQLLNRERKKLTRQYLTEPNLKLGQIAGLVGYSEQSAFNRACKDWFGATPRAVRTALDQGK
ncbi:AraC family transcriptional regulator [Marinobacter salinisoli]|uniref:AraC family transcriptional regulator n=1 Tax=Marinobacter salinisoli TaxID=2769486 RepID=A0ABX7MUD8_9GAMM|nr:AraC family transcriptional regulator [Marinobacter salinisoli]QSP94691.1 AraC family transcriptional regulator [Marinobacter salinisoli]